MSETRHVPLLIAGAGPAGLTAAIYAIRAGMSCEVIERAVPGGQVFIADRIENYPGFPDTVSGSELSDRMRDQALKLGATITQSEIKSVEVDGHIKKLTLTGDKELTCDALIIATGCKPRELGIPGEKKFWGRGVSYCATCDGNFFRDQKIAVIGGGDSACQEATMLSHLAKEVFIIHRRDQFRAQEYLVQCAMNEPNITTLWDSVAEGINGDESGVKSVSVKNVKTETASELMVDGVFIYVGIIPLSDFLGDVVDIAPGGYVVAGEDGKTSVPGIFAAGDVRTKDFRQIVTAASDGANAVRSCEIYFIERGLSGRYV